MTVPRHRLASALDKAMQAAATEASVQAVEPLIAALHELASRYDRLEARIAELEAERTEVGEPVLGRLVINYDARTEPEPEAAKATLAPPEPAKRWRPPALSPVPVMRPEGPVERCQTHGEVLGVFGCPACNAGKKWAEQERAKAIRPRPEGGR